ncbi:sensor histidine kinase [Thalassotalea sp. HSM 43]|uniref:sensor histidine kinase n=1 Tax=Thalassotalea sp. HSM 43 TaxID=2552945 RepID=UPI001081389D|nr:histidine kinase [Thalassotalea sp. HSM 43]QBY06071.1 sensor histidine kinase [Thalassotalea sp. HSM 43]
MNWQEFLENRNRFFWFLHIGGWVGFAFVHYLGSLLHDLRDLFTWVTLLSAYAGAIFSYPLRYVYRRAWNMTPLKIALVVIVSSYISGLLWQVVKNISYWEIYKHGWRPDFWLYYTQSSLWSFYIMLSWSGLYFVIKYYQMLQTEKQKVLSANNMANQAQLKMLRYQLNPHFLFNTLNAISTLVLIDENKNANAMVTKLSDFLRYSLDMDTMKKVTLAQEIKALQLYLDIEKVRFEDRLRIEFEIQKNCQNALVPSLLFQPLVENAIKYAIAVKENGGTISLKVSRFANDLLLELSDDGPGAKIVKGELARENGVGLANTRERLATLYDKNYSMVISDNVPSGVKINIRIPFQQEQ